MFVGDFEKIVTIKFAQRRCCLIEHNIDKLMPPAFVIIFARPVDRSTRWHSFPGREKGAVELLRIESQTNLTSDQRIMIADCLCQIKESANRVETDRFGHVDKTSNDQRPASDTAFS